MNNKIHKYEIDRRKWQETADPNFFLESTLPIMSKVMFNAEESVLKQWEQMHRPPDSIPTSGPAGPRCGSGTLRTSASGLVVPHGRGSPACSAAAMTAGAAGAGSTRRHSVISSSKDTVTSFPLRLSNGAGKNEPRRPSEVWLSKEKWSRVIVSHLQLRYILKPYVNMHTKHISNSRLMHVRTYAHVLFDWLIDRLKDGVSEWAWIA